MRLARGLAGLGETLLGLRAARGGFHWLLAVAVMLAAAPAAAQTIAIGQPIVSQTVTLDGRVVADPGILDLIETRTGAALAVADVRESIVHLVGLGRFDDVVVSADPVAGGVALRYALLPVRAIRHLEFKGNVRVSEGLLRDRAAARLGPAPPLSRTPELIQLLASVFHDEGYRNPTLTTRPGLEGKDGDTLVIDVDAGARLRIGTIEVSGNAPDPLPTLPSHVGLSEGHEYRKADVDRALDRLIANLRKRGYYEAHADHELSVSPDGRTGALAINVDAGPHVTIAFEGDPLSERARRDLVPIEREGSLDEDLLEDSANRIRDYLRGQGYRNADASYVRTPRNGELAVVFRITRGPQFRIGTVEIAGANAIPAADLHARLRTKPGELFTENVVAADVASIVESYHRRGYTQVKVTPVPVPAPSQASPVPIDVRLEIAEGLPTLVSTVRFEGVTNVPETDLRARIGSQPNQAYYQPQVALDREAVLLVLLNRGYQSAAVDVKIAFSDDHARADLTFTVAEGPQVFVDHVLIVGNERTATDTIRREVTLKPMAPLSYHEVSESQRRVSALGLFRRVRITELDHGVPSRRDVLVTVEEAPATTMGYGGGLEGGRVLQQSEDGTATEKFEIAPRGFIEFGRRNLFGRNQSINFFARASLRSRASTTDVEPGEQPPSGYTFRDYRVLGTYRSPRVLGTQSDLLLTAFSEQGIRSSFNFTRRGARVELARRLSSSVSVSGRYVIQRDRIFEARLDPEDKPLIDRLFPQVLLSTFSGSVIRDTRDDPLGPTKGALIGVDADLAARAIGSEVGFAKVFTQGFIYRRLPGRRGVVFAAGARLGLADGFDRGVVQTDENGNPVIGPDGEPVVEIVSDLPASERFFTGGDTSVRGYALDRLGTPETIDRNGFPTGGNAVIVLNGELRVPVWHDIGVVGFVDAGNVFHRVSDFDFSEIKPTTGVGLRYRSPIGPIRVDIGFKLDRQILPDGSLERLTAVHISLGQAF
jgi:outer membrane protein insertion porin family